MAASRGNRLSGCTGEEAMLVRGCDSFPVEDLAKPMGQGSPQGLHSLLRPPGWPEPRFLPTPIWAGRGNAQTLERCSPAVSAHSTIWGSGKWQRNPVTPVSPETLQGTSTNVTGCLLRPARHPPHASAAHLAGSAPPAACTTPGCAPSPPRAPRAGTCRSSAWGSLWGCGAKSRYRLSPTGSGCPARPPRLGQRVPASAARPHSLIAEEACA